MSFLPSRTYNWIISKLRTIVSKFLFAGFFLFVITLLASCMSMYLILFYQGMFGNGEDSEKFLIMVESLGILLWAKDSSGDMNCTTISLPLLAMELISLRNLLSHVWYQRLKSSRFSQTININMSITLNCLHQIKNKNNNS